MVTLFMNSTATYDRRRGRRLGTSALLFSDNGIVHIVFSDDDVVLIIFSFVKNSRCTSITLRGHQLTTVSTTNFMSLKMCVKRRHGSVKNKRSKRRIVGIRSDQGRHWR